MATARIKKNGDAVPTVTYAVLKNIEHDGENYKAGDSIDLDEANAKWLLDANAIQPPAAAE